jgi:hypothetical protein
VQRRLQAVPSIVVSVSGLASPFCTTCISDQLSARPTRHFSDCRGTAQVLASGTPVAAPGYYEYEPKQPGDRERERRRLRDDSTRRQLAGEGQRQRLRRVAVE